MSEKSEEWTIEEQLGHPIDDIGERGTNRWKARNNKYEELEEDKSQPSAGKSAGTSPAQKQDNKFLRKQAENENYWKTVEEELDNPEGYIVAVLKGLKVNSDVPKWKFFSGLNLDDYINLGRIGLLEAAKNFNPDKGKFSSYAWYYVYHQLMNEVDGIGASARYYKAWKLFLNIPEDLKGHLEVKKQNLKALREDVEKPDNYKEMDHLSKGEDEEGKMNFEPEEVSDLFADLREDDDEIVPRMEVVLIEKALEKLGKDLGKEYRIIFEEKYAEGKSLREIAKKDEITVSYRTVGRYLEQAEDKMADILGVRVTKSGNRTHYNSEGKQ